MKIELPKIVIISFILVTAVTLLLWLTTTESAGQQDKKSSQPIVVETIPVKRTNLEQTLNLTAEVKSDLSVKLKSEVSGRVSKVNFKEGDLVKQGQILIALDSETELATLAQEKATLSLKQSTRNRVSQLYKEGIMSAQKFDEAEAELNLAKANVDFAKAELNKKNIKAPFTGIVGIRSINVGDLVQPGTELVSINDNSKLRIIFDIPSSVKTDLLKDTPINVIVDNQRKIVIPINFIEQNVNQSTRTISAQILLDQTNSETNINLISGQFVEVQIPTNRIENVITIPEQALLPRGTKTLIYVIKNQVQEKNKTALMANLIPVNVLLRASGMVAIEGDISDNDRVVTAGQQKLRGEQVEVTLKEARPINMIPSAVEELPKASK
jgi:membrane fusion protein (multidrug efflux system)